MNYKDGLRNNHNRLYRIYVNMKSRCYNQKASRYNRYGGRGIRVCEEWLHDFKQFYDWAMVSGYSDSLSLDRIDCNKDYSPNNCRWVTSEIQNRNKENVPVYEFDGKKFTQSEVYELFGVKRTTFQRRLQCGCSVKDALKGGEIIGC